MNKIIRIGVVLLSLLPISTSVLGQDEKLTKEVQVVRPYEPSISDAFKLNQLPQVVDTIRVSPIFSYNIALRPVSINFPVIPIPPARMVAEPLPRISKGYAKVGFGNYSSPLLEAYYSNERSKEYSYGIWFKHNSSMGNVKLANNEKVDASFRKTNLSAFGKKIFENSALAGDVNFNRYGYGFYGNDTVQAAPPIPEEVEEQMQQKININISYFTTHTDSTHFNYKLDAGFQNFTDKFSMQQNTFKLGADLNKFFKTEKLGGEIEYINHMKNDKLSSSNSSIFSFTPWVGLFGKQWRVKAGLGISLDFNQNKTFSNIYPIALLSYDIVSNYVIPYFQFSGYLEDNNYQKILNENPWIIPGLNLWNTSHKFIMQGGVKGNFSPKVAYNLSASFSLVDSAYFFVNTADPSLTYLTNNFDVVYDNIRKKRFLGELTVAPNNKIKLFFQVEYNSYAMEEEIKPWHKPEYLARAIASYNIQDKILIKSNIFLEGKRSIRLLDGTAKEIDGFIDLNLGIEYRYNKRLSAFIDFNNLTAKRYQLWYLYPIQRFNMKAGLTYAL